MRSLAQMLIASLALVALGACGSSGAAGPAPALADARGAAPANSGPVAPAAGANSSSNAASAAPPKAVPATVAPTTPSPNAASTVPPPASTPLAVTLASLVITRLNYDGVVPRTESDEYVEVTNRGGAGQAMSGWKIVSVRAGQTYSFPNITIAAGQTCRVYTNEVHPDTCGLSWGHSTAIWNNAGDRANLVDPSGRVISTSGYGGY